MKKQNIKKLLNLNFTDLTNQTYSIGKYDMPYFFSNGDIDIDYLALYSYKSDYNKTENTAICFYEYDCKFDGKDGLFNAIYYKDERLLNKYKERFKNVRYFISPDYSQCGDVNVIENIYRLFKSRIVSIWLTLELNAVVIPNVTYANDNYYNCMLDGMEDFRIVSFSIMGSMRDSFQRDLLLKAIIKTVDYLHKLEKIIVFSVSINDDDVFSLFDYALKRNIIVTIPNNRLRKRNMIRRYS